VGDLISFLGSATDHEDGTIPASGLSWTIILHHCFSQTNCHTHLIQTFNGVSSGTFNAPDHQYPCWLELQLTATDSGGATATTSVRLDPQTVNLTLASSPTGAQLSLNSTAAAAPFTTTVVIGSSNTISAPSPQTIGSSTYTYTAWSDGGAQTHNVTAPATNTTYTASFAVTGTFGSTDGSLIGANEALSANTKMAARYVSPASGHIVRVEGNLSGTGQSSGSQALKAVVYADANGQPGALLGVSNPVTITAGQAFAWVPFTFSIPPPLAVGPVWIGFIGGGPTSGLIRLRVDAASGTIRSNADPYATGPSNPFGASTASQRKKLLGIRTTYGP
jgi:hypothetical protein